MNTRKQQWNPKLVTLIEATLSKFTQEEAPLVNEMVACDYTREQTISRHYRPTDVRQLSGMVLDRRRIGMRFTKSQWTKASQDSTAKACKLLYYIRFNLERFDQQESAGHSSD
jgi:hypothetical protein